ncbi:MAG: site-specific DNA-methyltransferase, partial [Candidatus Neomarinimicrobiota bacterium]
KVHPTQKPLALIERLIEIFTDVDDVVIDPCAGSAVTLLGAKNLNRRGYGFEIKKNFFKDANERVLTYSSPYLFCEREERKRLEGKQIELVAD